MNLVYEWEELIRNRCRKQDIDIDNCYVAFNIGYGIYFCGNIVDGFTESKDERWICIPVEDEELEILTGEYMYKPQCFEVRHKMKTWLSNGSMTVLTTVWILEK